LPSGDLSLDLNLLAINRYLAAGYDFIGLDHFARPNEALAQLDLYRRAEAAPTALLSQPHWQDSVGTSA
jgi:hypothetical protein